MRKKPGLGSGPLTVEAFIRAVSADPHFGGEMVHHEPIPAKAAIWKPLPGDVRPEVRAGLEALGITKLWSHQAEAVRRVQAGEDLVVVTPTASGKTLCYNLPVIDACATDPTTRALYLFPIKALEQDQAGAFRELSEACGLGERVTAEIYDGDTSAHRRAKIKQHPPNVVITNPDMLHMGILAFHEQWETFFANLRYVVLDEVHTYRGVFGSHLAHVLRRLLRVAAFYGAQPRIVACSATIANPGELTAHLTGRPAAVIDQSGAPEAGRHFLFLNSRRLSASTIAARLLEAAVKADLSTIVFTKARKMTELIYTWAVQQEPGLRKVVSAYRAGYLPEERRAIEQSLFSGKLKGVVSTSALEMGIDIGALDVCVLVGYPGAVTTTWQRGGRVGRQDRESLVVLVAQQDALDQYFMKHPRAFFDSGFEAATVDPGNRPILRAHLACAAAELPLRRDDRWYPAPKDAPEGSWEAGVGAALADLEKQGRLLYSPSEDAWRCSARHPQREVNLRGVGESSTIFEEPAAPIAADGKARKPRVIGSLDGHRVFSEGHPGAIYLHRAQQYEVTRLDLEQRNLFARRVHAGYYTNPLRDKDTEILAISRSTLVKNFVARLGSLKVTERVTGYEKKSISSGERLSLHALDLPPQSFETVGFWIEIDDFIPRTVSSLGLNFMGGIHALEHAAIALFPLFAFCERDDVGGISMPMHPQVGKSAVFIYDGYPGGVGLAERSFERIAEQLESTLRLIRGCDCEKGCPACIYSNKCGNGNVPLDKAAAVLILSLLLDREETRALVVGVEEDAEPPDTFIDVAAEEEPAPESRGPHVVVMDLETRRGASEVGGWGNIHLMGLALAVVWDSRTGEYVTYSEAEVDGLLQHMAKADLVVGFNIIGFDYRVLSAYDDGTLARLKTFDILYDLRKRLGWRLSLAHLAEHNLGASKSADGLQSLEWVRQGRMDLVEEYCRDDVRLTAELFQHGLREKKLRFADREGRILEIAVDWDLEQLAGP